MPEKILAMWVQRGSTNSPLDARKDNSMSIGASPISKLLNRVVFESGSDRHQFAQSVTSWLELDDVVRTVVLPGNELDLVLSDGARVRVVVKSIEWPGEETEPGPAVRSPR